MVVSKRRGSFILKSRSRIVGTRVRKSANELPMNQT